MKNFFITFIVSILVGFATFFGSPFILANTGSGSNDSANSYHDDSVDEDEDEDPDEGGEDPDEGGEDPDEGGEDPDEGGEDPNEGGEDPDEGGEDPDEGGEDPDEGGEDPDEGGEDSGTAIANQPKVKEVLPKSNTPNVEFLNLLKDVKKWSAYDKENIEFSYDFTPLDVSGNKMLKKDFLQKQANGGFIASKKADMVYQLNKVPDNLNPRIIKVAKGHASTALYCLNQEGRSFPNFEVKDIKGNVFSKDFAKGKILVVKCWFVQCLPCVKEFPELNHIYDKYESSDKIEFLSFAFDKEERLNKFLAKKEFRYPVLPEQAKFISKQIKARKYPSHLIIGKDGKILKMFNNVDILEHFIEKYK